jgi:hypothetical protein
MAVLDCIQNGRPFFMKAFKNIFIAAVFLTCTLSYQTYASDSLTINIKGDSVINTLSDYFFGMNYWQWTPTWGNDIEGTDSLIAGLRLSILRLGGINVDVDYPDTVNSNVLTEYDTYCKSVGASPMLQLPLARDSTTSDRVKRCAAMLDTFKAIDSVKLVSIGNEPDIYPDNLSVNSSYNVSYLSKYSLVDYCSDYNAVASAVKQKDSSIKVIGLELSWNRDVWVPDFVSACKDYIDMISLHYYPFNANQCTYANIRNQFSSIRSFYSSMRTLIDKNAGGKTIPLIIGEINLSWNGDPDSSKLNASPGTFFAGLWFADFIGVSSAQPNLYSIMPWSLREGWTLGFLASKTKPKPVYTIYKMFSNYSGKYMIHCENVNSYVKVYAYKDDSNRVSVFAVNWDTVSSYNAALKFTGILNNSTYNCVIPSQSLTCIVIPSDSSAAQAITCSGSDSLNAVTYINKNNSILKSVKGIKAWFNENRTALSIQADKPINNAEISILTLQGKILHKTKNVSALAGKAANIKFSAKIPSGPVAVSISETGFRTVKLTIMQ